MFCLALRACASLVVHKRALRAAVANSPLAIARLFAVAADYIFCSLGVLSNPDAVGFGWLAKPWLSPARLAPGPQARRGKTYAI